MKKRITSDHKLKRTVALVIVILIILGGLPHSEAGAATISDAWDGGSTAVPETDTDGTFLISTAAELAWFAEYVNAGHASVNARLLKTVYLNTSSTLYVWESIGSSESAPFSGHFDGNGKQILNMYCELTKDNAVKRYTGLFGVIDGGSVENLIVSGSILSGYADSDSSDAHELWSGAGGIVGRLKSGFVSGCTANVSITTANYCYYRNTGGIAGISEGMISGCENSGDIRCGAVGAQYHVGGICGMLIGPDAFVSCCSNTGAVMGYFQVGGIAGAVIGGAARFLVHYVVGATVWAEYMPENFLGMDMTTPWIYSLIYNLLYMLPNILITIVVFALLSAPLGKFLRGEDIK